MVFYGRAPVYYAIDDMILMFTGFRVSNDDSKSWPTTTYAVKAIVNRLWNVDWY